MSCTPAAIAQIRGPAWDIAEKFATAAVAVASAEVAKGGPIADIAKATVSGGLVAAEAEIQAIITKVTDLSGAVVDLSGAVVDLSGAVVDLSGVVVDISGASVPVGALPPAVPVTL